MIKWYKNLTNSRKWDVMMIALSVLIVTVNIVVATSVHLGAITC